jgi:protocatechuate 3,4-dioxygenase alpha subunit
MPVNDAVIEIWQANACGKYRHPEDKQDKPLDPAFLGFARSSTAEDGSCQFETVRPGRVPGYRGVLQAPHLNLSIFARGLLKRVITRIYFAGDTANEEDHVLAMVPPDRRETLIAHRDPHDATTWHFDISLRGASETVFFDI